LVSISDFDSDYAKDENDRRSISGRINTLGGMITNWTSKKQQTVSLSSSESEYQALSECVREAMFTQSLLRELIGKKTTSIIYEDNLGAIYLVKNMKVSARTKHIDIRHHFMREL
jgi:C4-type Zn-finger protein